MIAIEDFTPAPERLRGAYLAVGNFDGVHLGHASLIKRLRARADAAGVAAVALTFDPQPVALLRPGSIPPPLTWNDRKFDLIREAGATEVGVFQTGPWLLGLSAREFFDRVILGQFAAGGMVEGPTFGFGRDRGGDAAILADWCAGAGLDFEIAEPSEIDGRIVSSSRIRGLLAEGAVDAAALLLGRPHRVRGVVVRGAGRGAGLGFPTANLDGIDTQIPADGVYAALVGIDGEEPIRSAAVHVGANVTFGEESRTVEAHLLDFDGDLYGKPIQLDWLRRLRPSRKFAGIDELLAQIGIDVAEARGERGA